MTSKSTCPLKVIFSSNLRHLMVADQLDLWLCSASDCSTKQVLALGDCISNTKVFAILENGGTNCALVGSLPPNIVASNDMIISLLLKFSLTHHHSWIQNINGLTSLLPITNQAAKILWQETSRFQVSHNTMFVCSRLKIINLQMSCWRADPKRGCLNRFAQSKTKMHCESEGMNPFLRLPGANMP